MANQKKPGGSKLNEDELIKNLVPDPSQVPDARMLFGFLGKSSREGYWRLYLTPELNEYVEFQEEDVLHTQSFATPENPLGGKAVWVKRETNLLRTSTKSREAQAEFLQGDIAASLLAGTTRGRLSGVGGIPRFTPNIFLRDPTLFHADTCVLSPCISKYAVCTNPGQTTCDPAVCFQFAGGIQGVRQ